MRMSETLEAYQIELTKPGSSGTIRTYMHAVKRFVEFIGDKDLCELAMDDVAKYNAALSQSLVERKDGLGRPYKNFTPSAAYVATQLSALKSYMGWLKDTYHLPNLDLDRFKRLRPRITRQKPNAPELWEITVLQEQARDREDKMMVSLLSKTGLRIQEMLSLYRQHIEAKRREDGTIEYSLKVACGKGSKTRDVPLNMRVPEELFEYLTYLDVVYPGSQKLFHRAYKTTWRRLKKLGETAGLKNLSPHSLRHAFATQLLNKNVSIRTIQDLLGHESIATTQIYTQVSDELKRAAVEKL